jgi:hypothetical protein
MLQSIGPRSRTGPAVLGLLLIVLGIASLIVRDLGFNMFGTISSWGWPFFVIVPGVVLLAAALVPAPPKGLGFAIAGAIVTTVGGLLLYQSGSGHWNSWAYAWSLIPLAAGLALVAYGLIFGQHGLVGTGTTLAGIALALFLVGGWFFEGVFAGENRPTDISGLWPFGVIVLGAVILIRSFMAPTRNTNQAHLA